MPLALQCKFFGHVITIEKALAIKDAATTEQKHTLPFECVKCGEPVRPRMAGDKWIAHFVHLDKKAECFAEAPRPY